MPDRPKPGQLEERSEPISVEGQKIRGVVPYGTPSRDLGGYTEVIHAGALDSAKLDDLVVTVDHTGLPLGRYPSTLQLEDRSDGMHWSVDPPKSRQDVIEAIERGDLKAGSWRMRVARDRWEGDTRHIEQIAELRDVSIVTAPAYEAAVVEYRSQPDPATGQEDNMATEAEKNTEEMTSPDEVRTEELKTEDRAAPTGGLRVEDRNSAPPPRGMAEEFRAAGFPGRPGELAMIDFDANHFEDRAVTWTGSVDNINKNRYQAGGFGYDQRWAWPASRTSKPPLTF
jgi:HK97 family phage prohead protease